MGRLAREASRLAYRGQQVGLQVGCGAVQAVTRRLAFGSAPGLWGTRPEGTHVLRRRFTDLLARDWAQAQAGLYPVSLLFDRPWKHYARRLPRLAADVPKMFARMKRDGWRELPDDVELAELPPYYRRTFHWQTDGYWSTHSAELYDVAVEFLFGGMADVMRRQALVPIVTEARRHSGALRILDVACGTARTLHQARAALPEASLTGLDLSPYYLERARRWLGPDVSLVEGNAEAMPFEDQSFDAVTCVYLFHELPRAIRRRVLGEMRRVTKPGGLVVLVDSVQERDAAALAYFLRRFQREMHEPFFAEYLTDSLEDLASEVGLEREGPTLDAYLSKVVAARVPR